MKKVVIIALIGVISIVLTSASFAASKGVINTDTARIRSEATADSSIVALASLNENVEILEETGAWYKIKYAGKTGYISKRLVDVEGETNKVEEVSKETQEPQKEESQENVKEENKENTEEATNKEQEKESQVSIKESFVGKIGTEISVKILPTISSRNITKINKDSEITVIEMVNDWCYIKTAENTGWVRVEVLSLSVAAHKEEPQQEEKVEEKVEEKPEEKVEEKKEETAEKKEKETTKKVGYVNVDTVNFRKKATTSSEVIDSLSINTEVSIVAEENDWYKVKVDGETGYVSKKYISDEKVPEVTSRASETTRESVNAQPEEKVEEKKETEQNTTANTDLGNQIVAYAKQYIGYKYVSGGSKPSTGFDCSGFTTYVYGHFGISLNRSSCDQIKNGKAVSKANLQIGDLVVFNNSSNSAVGHVGIYIGNNQFIHASNPSSGVKITSLSDSYYSARYVGARRVF